MRALVITADNTFGRTLLALRAGAMSPDELGERFPSGHRATELVRHGLVAMAGGYYQLTAAGREACPLRNPLAARNAAPVIPEIPKEEPMVTKTEVLADITAAGPQGLPRAQLVARYGTVADNQISILFGAGKIYKPTRGVLVSSQFKPNPDSTPTGATSAPADQPPVSETTAAAGQAEPPFSPQPLAEAEAAPVPAAAPTAPAREDSAVEVTPNPLEFSGDEIEFGIWSSGRLTICDNDQIIELAPEATRKLRVFLGLVAEEQVAA